MTFQSPEQPQLPKPITDKIPKRFRVTILLLLVKSRFLAPRVRGNATFTKKKLINPAVFEGFIKENRVESWGDWPAPRDVSMERLWSDRGVPDWHWTNQANYRLALGNSDSVQVWGFLRSLSNHIENAQTLNLFSLNHYSMIKPTVDAWGQCLFKTK